MDINVDNLWESKHLSYKGIDFRLLVEPGEHTVDMPGIKIFFAIGEQGEYIASLHCRDFWQSLTQGGIVMTNTKEPIQVSTKQDILVINLPSDQGYGGNRSDGHRHILVKAKLAEIKNVRNSSWLFHLPGISNISQKLNPNDLYLLVGPSPTKGGLDYAVRGPEKFLMTLALTSTGEGPYWHKHTIGTEIFMVLCGTFTVQVSKRDSLCKEELSSEDFDTYTLDCNDFIRVPVGRFRRFFQTSPGDDGVLLAFVLGVNDESRDIQLPAWSKEDVFGSSWFSQNITGKLAQSLGLRFTD